jgi:hypothetical protein
VHDVGAIVRVTFCAASLAVISLAAGPVLAQTPEAVAVAAPASAPIAPPAANVIMIPEGTEFPMRLEDTLSSKHANEGDRFTVTLDEDIPLSNGVLLRAGYRGVGEVIDARSNGMLGKTGKLGIRLSYLRVGDQRIKLRASRDVQGKHNTGAQVGTLLLIWPVMPFIKGKSTQIRKGTVLTAFADSDVTLQGPLPLPPPDL